LKGSEMELQAGMKLTTNRIASILNVPPVLLNPENSSYNNLKEAKKELITAACFPELDSLRDDWNAIAQLYKGEDLYVDYDPSVYPELQEDMEKMVRSLKEAWWYTGNERRLKMSEDEDTDNPIMNEYVIPSGMILLSDLGLNDVDKNIEDDEEEDQPKPKK
jgi:phage portal protein BeeE